MNTNNEGDIKNNILQGDNINKDVNCSNIPNEIINKNLMQKSVQNIPVHNQSQSMKGPIQSPQLGKNNIKSNTLIIVGVILILVSLGYYRYTGLSKKICIDNFKSEITTTFNNQMVISSGDTQYIFDSRFDPGFISKAINFDNLKIKICYTNAPATKLKFQLGESTKTKMVDNFELYEKTNNKKINATNINELLKELGYHTYGKYTEEATIVEMNSTPKWGYSSGKHYISYSLKIEFLVVRKWTQNIT